MALTNQDILFASLVGAKATEQIPRFSAIQNELMKHVLPPIPFLPLKNVTEIETVDTFFYDEEQISEHWKADRPTPQRKQFFPFTFKKSITTTYSPGVEQSYLLPYEPMISISGRNNIIMRNVAKAGTNIKGTVKERWNVGDYEITITGALIGDYLTGSVENCYPKKDFETLRDYMLGCSIDVQCEPLQLLGINTIVVETFDFPFTKGENVQAYEIKAYSDFSFDLFMELND